MEGKEKEGRKKRGEGRRNGISEVIIGSVDIPLCEMKMPVSLINKANQIVKAYETFSSEPST